LPKRDARIAIRPARPWRTRAGAEAAETANPKGLTCTAAKPPIPYDQKPAEHRPADPLLSDDHRSENAERDACPDEMAQREMGSFLLPPFPGSHIRTMLIGLLGEQTKSPLHRPGVAARS
jgi:hypothetical protein